MYLRDTPLLNFLRRLRGWRLGDLRVMVEAKDQSQHVFLVFECRAASLAEAEKVVAEQLARDGLAFVEIAQNMPATVPMPRDRQIISLSDPIPFGEAVPAMPRSEDVLPR